MFEGLHTYEIIVLILGVFLFMILLALLIRQIVKRQSTKQILPLFGLSLIMMVYPGIKSFSISASEIAVEKATDALKQNPEDTVAKSGLRNAIADLQGIPISLEASVKIARAHVALGDTGLALQKLDSIVKVDPIRKDAISLRNTLLLPVIVSRSDSLDHQPHGTGSTEAELLNVTGTVHRVEATGGCSAFPYIILLADGSLKMGLLGTTLDDNTLSMRFLSTRNNREDITDLTFNGDQDNPFSVVGKRYLIRFIGITGCEAQYTLRRY